MSAHPTWFGPADRPIFGWLHLPEGQSARAGVVCCTSVGSEATSAHRPMKLLADELEASGFAVLRFDYAGTGDSAGEGDDDGQVRAWRSSVTEAVGFLRHLGACDIGLVGLRLGATLAALEAAADGSVTALALWDPCVNGKAFLREQQALTALSIGPGRSSGKTDQRAEPGPVELLGWVLGPGERSELEGLSLDGLEPPTSRCLVLFRDDRPLPLALRSWDGAAGVEWAAALGQGELTDVLPHEAKVPTQSLAIIASWFDRVMPPDRRPLLFNSRTHVPIPPEGSMVVHETAVQLGELGLFAVVTEAPGRRPAATVMFLNAGVIPHVGPARLWVTLARRLAARGIRVVRLDLSGLGDSPVRAGQAPHRAYPPEAIDDVEMVLDALGIRAEDVVVAGSCSGAYHAIEAGLRLAVRGVCCINPILSFDPPESKAGAKLARDRQAVAPFNGLIKRLRRFSRLAEWGEFRCPPALWWALDRIGLQAHPAHALEALARRGVPVALLCGEVEARPFLRRATWSFDTLVRSGAVEFDLLVDSDHNLFGAAARARAEILILDRLTALAERAPGGGVDAGEAGHLLRAGRISA